MRNKFVFIVIAAYLGIMTSSAVQTVSGPLETAPAPLNCPDSSRASMTIMDMLNNDSNFADFKNFILSAGMAKDLQKEGSFTVFIPTNNAFNNLSNGDKKELAQNNVTLRNLLRFHIIEGCLKTDFINGKMAIENLYGGSLKIERSSEGISVNGANLVIPDIICSNGIIHGIDTVLIPTTSGIQRKGETKEVKGNSTNIRPIPTRDFYYS
jgi:uncharacterized surface protein with fasciclin (FAS1) repeats